MKDGMGKGHNKTKEVFLGPRISDHFFAVLTSENRILLYWLFAVFYIDVKRFYSSYCH